MDNINGLHDDLRVKILSFLPTKVAVSTCVLSKRWEFLWMWLPKLEFITEYVNHKQVKPGLGDFINKKLQLHRAPVIESLLLKLRHNAHIKPDVIKRWIDIVVSRYVGELEIAYIPHNENIFPSNLFSCKSLVTLKLKRVTLMDVPSMVCLPCLKTLQLKKVKFVDEKSLQQLLSICPVLEDLTVLIHDEYEMKEFTIIVPSLQILSLMIPHSRFLLGYEIDTPLMKYLKLEDCSYPKHYSLIKIKNMPKLIEVYTLVGFSNINLNTFIGSITSIKRLTIIGEGLYGNGFVYNQLEHLNICVCKEGSLNLLGQLLEDSPNLRVLHIFEMENQGDDEHDGMVSWNQPSSVPKCLLSSLQFFSWSSYIGRPRDRDIVAYILKNARHLKKATISSQPFLYMLKELGLSP